MAFADRMLTIAVTATLTSAAWIVVGGGLRLEHTATGRGAPPDRTAEPARPNAAADRAPLRAPRAADGAALVVPVAGVSAEQLIDTFGDLRGEGTRSHGALDIMAPAGTPVIAALGGTIERLLVSKDGGNTIYLRTGDGATIHYYVHLGAYAPGLADGRQVQQGEALGTVGSTGNASPEAPHLHFAVLRTEPGRRWSEPAAAVNPYDLLRGP
ncbi:MAG: hypothetical protein B7Z08_06480 [Sphingomonadales bacterium 32-68-7]|nr:MAG: hypothetical protein B7Z08_06480 [Sphingomonadales bacterium 32-68-7]